MRSWPTRWRLLDRQLPLDVAGADRRRRRAPATSSLSTDPGAPDRVVARAATARPDEVQAAVAEACRGFAQWREVSQEDRSAALIAAAAWMRERRLELTALEVRECAKPWVEADADVCEAIDFLEYYARAGLELGRGRELLQVPGERNELRYAAARRRRGHLARGTSRSRSPVE